MKKKELIRKKKKVAFERQIRLIQIESEKKAAILLIIMGIALIGASVYLWLNRNYQIKKEELISIDGTITNHLKLRRLRKHGKSMKIQLTEYPEIDFETGRFGTRGLKLNSLKKNVKIGDKIKVDVLKKDFAKIKTYKKRRIFVYGVSDDKMDYLNVNDCNRAIKKDRNPIFLFLLFAFSFWTFGYGVNLIRKNK